jgi:hypothetical protein
MSSSVKGPASIDLFQPRLTANNVVSTNHEEPHYVVPFGLILLPLSLGPQCLPHCPILDHPPSMLFPRCDRRTHKAHVLSATGAAVHTRYVGD